MLTGAKEDLMDADRFDAVTVALTSAFSRRCMLRAMATTTGVGGLPALRQDVVAACKNVGRKCNKKKDCCTKRCTGKKDKERCRCLKLSSPCSGAAGTERPCCGSMTCDTQPAPSCPQGAIRHCCVPVDSTGCSDFCDCCGIGLACHDGRCCRPLGAPCSMQNPQECCSGKCGNGCIP